MSFVGYNSPNFAYIDSYLYPARYFRLYSDMMGVNEDMLRKVGELCSKPEFKNETLNVQVLNLEIIKNQ